MSPTLIERLRRAAREHGTGRKLFEEAAKTIEGYPEIDYSMLQEIAREYDLDYNKFCAAFRAAVEAIK